MKTSRKVSFVVIIVLLISMSITFIYTLDRAIMPRVIRICDAQARKKVTEVINQTINDEYTNNFNYDEMITIDKDESGNITMMRANTMKLNEMATNTVLKAQKKLEENSVMDVKVPIGQITNNNLLADMGPSVKVRVEPIGYITTKYLSDFESAGINQTRHKIYIEATCNVKLLLPFESSDVEIVSQIPVVETIIVGKVPNTAVQLDLNGK